MFGLRLRGFWSLIWRELEDGFGVQGLGFQGLGFCCILPCCLEPSTVVEALEVTQRRMP